MTISQVKVTKGPDDPICTRISMGGDQKIGAYCTFRGELSAAIEIAEACLAALRAAAKKPMRITPIPEIGKPPKTLSN